MAVTRPYTVNQFNQYTAAGGTAFGYDANGNLTASSATGYTYDVENRLVAASGGHNATLRYDPLGRLYEVAGTLATTRFVHDGDELLWEEDGAGSIQRVYVHGPGADDPLVWYELTGGPLRRFLRHRPSGLDRVGRRRCRQRARD